MNRRQFNASLLAGGGLLLTGCAEQSFVATPAAPVRTRWSIRESEGYDALCFWAALASEPEPARQYAEEITAFAPRLDARLMQTVRAVHGQVAAQGNVLTHSACRFFSAGPHGTIDELLHGARNIDTVLKPAHLTDPEWEGEQLWERYRQLMPVAITYLEALKAAGFPEFRRNLYQTRYADRIAEAERVLTPYQVISEVQFLTGRAFAPEVEVCLTYFSYPRGMRMLGQQFVTWAGYSDETILNTSAHELMHPPLDLRGETMQRAISRLFANGRIVALVQQRNPALGDVGDLPNYAEECMVQALDQIASERRGASRTAVEFFSRSNGADVLAACFYGLLKQDGYERTGGNFEAWVDRAVAGGRFSPESLEAAGTRILGQSPYRIWRPYRADPPST